MTSDDTHFGFHSHPDFKARAVDAGSLGSLPHSGPRVGPEASHHIVDGIVRAPQIIRDADGVAYDCATPTVMVQADRDGVTYCWQGVPKDRALALFDGGANPTVIELVRALGPCTVEMTERMTMGFGGIG